jgi:hypothetical protein
MACSIEDQRVNDLKEMQRLLNLTLEEVAAKVTDKKPIYKIVNDTINIYEREGLTKPQVVSLANKLRDKIEDWAEETYGKNYKDGWARVEYDYWNKAVVILSVPSSIMAARESIIYDLDIAETLAEMNSVAFTKELMAEMNSASNVALREQEERSFSFFINEFVETEREIKSEAEQLTLDFYFDESAQTNNARVDYNSVENIIKERNKKC